MPHLFNIDGELGAEHCTQPADKAASSVAYLRGMVSLGIKEARHLQDVTWAIGRAQLAALAALNDEVDLATRNYNPILIERFTPEFHVSRLLEERTFGFFK